MPCVLNFNILYGLQKKAYPTRFSELRRVLANLYINIQTYHTLIIVSKNYVSNCLKFYFLIIFSNVFTLFSDEIFNIYKPASKSETSIFASDD